jgi:hypothetical protein
LREEELEEEHNVWAIKDNPNNPIREHYREGG